MQSWKKTAQKHWFLPYTSHAHSSNLSSTLSSSHRLIVASFVCGEGRVMFLICRQIETRCRWVTNYENTNKSDDGNVFSPPNFAITSSTWYPWAPSHQWRMMAGSEFSVATVLQLHEKTKFQRWEQNITAKSRWCKWFLTVKLRSLFADDVSSGFGVLVLVVPGCGRPGNRRCVTVDMTRWRWAINVHILFCK